MRVLYADNLYVAEVLALDVGRHGRSNSKRRPIIAKRHLRSEIAT